MKIIINKCIFLFIKMVINPGIKNVNNDEIIDYQGTEEYNGKAVQLYIKKAMTPILALAPDSWGHGSILDKILGEMGINFDKINLLDGTFHAKKEGDLYIAVGMSFARIRGENIILFEDSYTYPLKPNQEHADKVKPYAPRINITID